MGGRGLEHPIDMDAASSTTVTAYPQRKGPTRPLSERLLRWGLSASAVGILTSIFIHCALVIVSVLFYLGVAGPGHGMGDSGGEIELALGETGLTKGEDAALEAGGSPAIESASLPGAELPLSGVGSMDVPIGGGGPGEKLSSAGGGIEGDGIGGGGDGIGGAGGGGGASFFGVEAKGTRFAYIVDVSGSMRGEKLVSLQAELEESISSLLEHMSFVVYIFSTDSSALGNKDRWTEAKDTAKKWASQLIRKLEAQGGTVPGQAFEMVFKMVPRPEAIYFMTDGLFDPSVADAVAYMNRGSRKVPIHCIAFMSQESEETMRKIAKESGGSYTFVAGPRRK